MMAMGCRRRHVIFSIIGCLMSLVDGAPVNPCTDEKITQCLGPLKGAEYEVGQAVVPILDRDTLQDHCLRYDEFETCMEDIKPYCSLVERLVYQGIEDSYQFLCYDGFEEYFNHLECFSQPELHQEGDRCNNTFASSLTTLKGSGQTSTYQRDRICQYVKQYLDCVENVVVSFCSQDAADWQRTLDEKSLSPLLSRMGCHLGGTPNWVPITIGVALTISVIIIIMAIGLLVMQKRKRRLEGAAARQQLTGAPPPYDSRGACVVYNNGSGVAMANGVQQQAGPIPEKNHTDSNTFQPPPYQSAELCAHPCAGASPPDDEAVAQGYFGATPSNPKLTEQDQKAQEYAAEEMRSGLQMNESIPLPQYEQLGDGVDDGFGPPEYEEMGKRGPIRGQDTSGISGISNPGYDGV